LKFLDKSLGKTKADSVASRSAYLAKNCASFAKSESQRTGIENKWYALTGRVVDLRAEEDGDLTLAFKMQLATNQGSLYWRYSQNRNGASIAKLYLVGLKSSFHSVSDLVEN
jgi:hypothetical protein